MFKGVKAYLYDGQTVVLNKSDIKNAEEEKFQEVSLYVSVDFIKESYKELEVMGELEENEDDDNYEILSHHPTRYWRLRRNPASRLL